MEHGQVDTRHAILIPMQGLPMVAHSEVPIDAEALLREHQESGALVHFTLQVDEVVSGRLVFLADGLENVQAREFLARLTGVHMVITGPAVFLGVDPEQVATFIRDLD